MAKLVIVNGVVAMVAIASLLLLLDAEPVSAAAPRNWRLGSNNRIYWDTNCFISDDNRVGVAVGVVSSQCGFNCLANTKCTHFYWYSNSRTNYGTCMLFNIPKGTKITDDSITPTLCGFAVGRSMQTI